MLSLVRTCHINRPHKNFHVLQLFSTRNALVAHGLTSSSILIQIDTDSLKPFFALIDLFRAWGRRHIDVDKWKKRVAFIHGMSLPSHTQKSCFVVKIARLVWWKPWEISIKRIAIIPLLLKGKLVAYNNWRALENWSNLFSLERENCHSMRRAARAIHFRKVYCCVIL